MWYDVGRLIRFEITQHTLRVDDGKKRRLKLLSAEPTADESNSDDVEEITRFDTAPFSIPHDLPLDT